MEMRQDMAAMVNAHAAFVTALLGALVNKGALTKQDAFNLLCAAGTTTMEVGDDALAAVGEDFMAMSSFLGNQYHEMAANFSGY